MVPIYLSTGTFTGRINGRNTRLLSDHWRAFEADGFELMVFDEMYAPMAELVRLYKGIPIPVVHADKRIGDLLSREGTLPEAQEMLLTNARFALDLGAKRMVIHGWGIPDSDKYPERSYGRILEMHRLCREMGVEMLTENCCCVEGSPLAHFRRLAEMDENIRFIVDTRPAQFHRELKETLESDVFAARVRHMHINDYRGGYKDWQCLYPIPQPGKGDIDWNMVFSRLRSLGYRGTVTLEAPSMLAQGVDAETLNGTLRYLRDNLAGLPGPEANP